MTEYYSAIGFEVITNTKPQLGQSHSLQLAVRAAERTEVKALLILLADMPFVSAKHIAAIAAQNILTASTEGTRAMPPALFPRSCWLDLLQTTGDAGARTLLANAHLVSAPPHELCDIDVPADLRDRRV